MKWIIIFSFFLGFSSYAGVNAEDCEYSRRGVSHNNDDGKYNQMIAELSGDTGRDDSKKKRRRKGGSEGLR